MSQSLRGRPLRGWDSKFIHLSLNEELIELRKRNKELDKENRRLKEENEFLEEAGAFSAASRRKPAKN